MLCPKCGERLQVGMIESVEIHRCPQCTGTWFDQDELRKAKDAVEPDSNWMDFEIWKHEDLFEVSSSALPCPRCSVPTAAINYGETEIEIDHCTRCEGVWLDRGEFGKIIDVLGEEILGKSVPDYITASLEEAREIIGGAEGFVSEWRDFLTVIRLLQYRVLAENPRLHEALAVIGRIP